MIAETVTCDICSKQKQQTNHWLMVYRDDEGFTLRPWNELYASAECVGYLHICGQECAVTALSKWMQELQVTSSDKQKKTNPAQTQEAESYSS